jgi:hypothetical protein
MSRLRINAIKGEPAKPVSAYSYTTTPHFSDIGTDMANVDIRFT